MSWTSDFIDIIDFLSVVRLSSPIVPKYKDSEPSFKDVAKYHGESLWQSHFEKFRTEMRDNMCSKV